MRILVYTLLFGIAFSAVSQQKGKQTLAQLEDSPAGSKIIWFLDALEVGEMSDQSIVKYFAPKLIDKSGVDKLKGVLKT